MLFIAMTGLETEESKITKLYAAIKKVVAKEFLWAILSLILAMPLAAVSVYLFNTYGSEELKTTITKLLNGQEIYTIAYVVNLAGIYFSRMVIGAITTLTTKKAA
ncbi:MAG: hypothetical protein AAGB24_00105 [Bacteroidota bacterium]